MSYQKAAVLDDLWNGEMRRFRVAGRNVLLMKVAGMIKEAAAPAGPPVKK